MVQTIARIGVKKDKIEEFIELFKEMIEPTLQEEGSLKYNMYQDEVDSSIFVILEEWENRDNFEDYLLSKHFDRVFPKMMKVMSKEIELNIMYKVA